ncbi:M15 family metallopeptidase [Nocardioides insulae]|uniref:M15 family metallopeptidase n=1 Tax=Nocardioides insulae TaxID=394734 RepID=UPI0004181316|nr:M15 family metallopeptidase [Nocardioides insulae]
MRPWGGYVVAAVLLAGSAGAAAGCADDDGATSDPPPASTPGSTPGSTAGSPESPAGSATPSPSSPSPTATTTGPAPPGTTPPDWLGTRVLPTTAAGYGEIRRTPPELRTRAFTLPDRLPMLPGDGFASRVAAPAPAKVIARSTWARGCPVGRGELAWIRLTFWGFDDARHTGELLVNARVADDLVSVFRELYDARFPIEEMRIPTQADQEAEPTGDGNDTAAFACRPVRGETTYSQHAYGLAVDVNPFQNPYVNGDVVLPELASAYIDRSRRAPGMIHDGDAVTEAFAGIGWGWGGSWQSLKDYQHFSENGR